MANHFDCFVNGCMVGQLSLLLIKKELIIDDEKNISKEKVLYQVLDQTKRVIITDIKICGIHHSNKSNGKFVSTDLDTKFLSEEKVKKAKLIDLKIASSNDKRKGSTFVLKIQINYKKEKSDKQHEITFTISRKKDSGMWSTYFPSSTERSFFIIIHPIDNKDYLPCNQIVIHDYNK